MIPRLTSFLAGLALAAVGAFAALGDDGLCVNNHPRRRPPDVTYGGLPAMPGQERDHKVPLCLGGPDVADNVQYQPLMIAHMDDELERATCRAYCRGEITLERAKAWLAQQKHFYK